MRCRAYRLSKLDSQELKAKVKKKGWESHSKFQGTTICFSWMAALLLISRAEFLLVGRERMKG